MKIYRITYDGTRYRFSTPGAYVYITEPAQVEKLKNELAYARSHDYDICAYTEYLIEEGII